MKPPSDGYRHVFMHYDSVELPTPLRLLILYNRRRCVLACSCCAIMTSMALTWSCVTPIFNFQEEHEDNCKSSPARLRPLELS
ncbi:hypothetical protein TWF173_010176 [Orbilia oligospora]|nr:hypothetical protein TWF173_010176 [Orbilia oligospora]